MRLGLCGLGKAGKNFVEFVNKSANDKLCAVLCRDTSLTAGKSVIELTHIQTDMNLTVQKISEFTNKEEIEVLIDFSNGETTVKLVEMCCRLGICLVICPTNILESQLLEFEKMAYEYKIGIIYAPTLTVGINALISFISEFAKENPQFSFEIIEKHGKNKAKPTKTAQIIADEMNRDNIAISSIRLDGFVGVHEVIATNGYEKIIFEHESMSRDAFSNGALVAAKYIVGRVGLFNAKNIRKG